MAYLEELLPEFRKGAKIRKKYWDKCQYIYYKDNNIYTHKNICINLTGDELVAGYWEFYKNPAPDWQYIINNKCLCRFWDDSEERGRFDILINYYEDEETFSPYKDDWGDVWENCRPVRRDEITFYEEK